MIWPMQDVKEIDGNIDTRASVQMHVWFFVGDAVISNVIVP